MLKLNIIFLHDYENDEKSMYTKSLSWDFEIHIDLSTMLTNTPDETTT